MPQLTVKINEEEFNEAKATLAGVKDGLVRAYARALNTATDGTKTDMVALARDDYSFKADAVRARISTKRAVWTDLSASVTSTGGPVPLTDFIGTRETSSGLTVNVKKSTGLQYIKHAFTAPGRYSGKTLAFWRLKPEDLPRVSSKMQAVLSAQIAAGHVSKTTGLVWRQPIMALFGPHPEVVFNTEENWGKIGGMAGDRLDAAFRDEVDGVLRQYGGQ